MVRAVLPTLEVLLENVAEHPDNLGKDISSELREVKRVHGYFTRVQGSNRQQLEQIAQESGISIRTLQEWRRKFNPDVLERYREANPYFHLTQDQRVQFAYLLGLAFSKPNNNRNNESLERVISTKQVRDKVSHAIRSVTKREPIIHGKKVEYNDVTLMKTLEYCFHARFEQSVANDQERIAFLQGFFTIDERTLTRRGQRELYIVTLSGPHSDTAMQKIAMSMLELDIAPRITKTRLTLSGEALKKAYDQHIFVKPCDKSRLKKYFSNWKSRLSLEQYYEIRRRVLKLVKTGHAINYSELGRTFGVQGPDINRWTSDITGSTRKLDVPCEVVQYNDLCAFLGIENMYEAQDPFIRNDKLFFPVEGRLYWVGRKAREKYLAIMGLDGLDSENIIDLWDQVEYNVEKNDSEPDVVMVVGERNEITQVDPVLGRRTHHTLAIRDEVYTISRRAAQWFDREYGYALNNEGLEYLRVQLAAQLANEKGDQDLVFIIEDNVIESMVPNPRMNFGDRRDYEGSFGQPTYLEGIVA